MATQAHCAFCFETLSAHLQGRQSLSLAQVVELWEQYHATIDDEDSDLAPSAKPAAISRLLDKAKSATSSSSSLPSTNSGTSSIGSSNIVHSAATTPSSSEVSLPTPDKQKKAHHPLFVTWNTHSGRRKHKSLRGCIGTFEAQELEHGLSSYALTSALDDVRFSPITASELPQLSTHVTLLTDFSAPVRDPLDWTVGVHGIRISFTLHGRRYGSTYLPDVAKEQGWTKDEAMISLMRKAGWNGSSNSWQTAWKDGRGELIRYEGKQVGLEYAEWQQWRDWVKAKHMTR